MASWPIGTSASASSYHAAWVTPSDSCPQGCYTTYIPYNAIDRNISTFWNDDTLGVFPDSLFITFPSATPVNLTGLQVLSAAGGYITSYDVYLSVAASSTSFLAASVINIANQFTTVGSWNVPNSHTDFKGDVLDITAIEIRVNGALGAAGQEYTRINEVYPIYAVSSSSNTPTRSSSSSSSSSSSTHMSSHSTTAVSTSISSSNANPSSSSTTSTSSGSSLRMRATSRGMAGGFVGIIALVAIGMYL